MIAPFNKSEQLENYRLNLGYIHALLTFNANTTAASITVGSNNPGVKMFAETSGQPTVTEDTQTTFGTLDSNADQIALQTEAQGTMVANVKSKGADAFDFLVDGAPKDAKPLQFARQK